MWNEAILEKFPEEENEEPFHASPAETENTGKTEVHGGTVETSHGCSAQSDGARKNTCLLYTSALLSYALATVSGLCLVGGVTILSRR